MRKQEKNKSSWLPARADVVKEVIIKLMIAVLLWIPTLVWSPVVSRLVATQQPETVYVTEQMEEVIKNIQKVVRDEVELRHAREVVDYITRGRAGQGGEECQAVLCSDFTEDIWEGRAGFIRQSDSPILIISPNLTESFPGGRMMYVNHEIQGSFEALYSFIPLGPTASNVVVEIAHLFRCIIGEGDYRTLGCQVNSAFPLRPEVWEYVQPREHSGLKAYLNGNVGLESQTEVNVRLSMDTRDDGRSAVIVVGVSGVSADGITNRVVEEITYDVTFRISLDGNAFSLGFGLLDPHQTHDVLVAPLNFELDYRLPLSASTNQKNMEELAIDL